MSYVNCSPEVIASRCDCYRGGSGAFRYSF
jgi:hypothetical protein